MSRKVAGIALLSGGMILSGCSTTTEETSTEIPAVKVPIMRYKMSKRPNIPWDPECDYKAVSANRW